MISALFLFALLTALCESYVLPPRNAVLNKKTIITPSFNLKTTSHQSAPCARDDVKCWCRKAVEYTNDERRRVGVSMLEVGTESQFENAQKWAEKLARERDLYHQDLGQASKEVGCGRSIFGENAAYNYESGDVARACVDQWISSPPHHENLVKSSFEEASIGFGFNDGAVYCVQTFAVVSDPSAANGEKCRPMGGSSTEPVPEEPNPQGTPESKPEDKPEDKPESDMSPVDPMVGRSSCRCIQKGQSCRTGLESTSNNKCTAKTESADQSSECVKQCCDYCAMGGSKRRCEHPTIAALCG